MKSKFWKLFFPPLLKLIHSQQKHCSCLRHSLPYKLFYEEKKKQEATLSTIPHSPLPAPTSSVLGWVREVLLNPYFILLRLRSNLFFLCMHFQVYWDCFSMNFKKRNKENYKEARKKSLNPLISVGGLSCSCRAPRCCLFSFGHKFWQFAITKG